MARARKGHGLLWATLPVRVVAILILLIITAVAIILATERGTTFALREGLAQYNALIPGKIHIRELGGSLLSGLRMGGITLEDRQGRVMAEVENLTLRYDPVAFRHNRLVVSYLALDRPTVHLYSHGQGSFADLAPESEAQPEPPTDDQEPITLPFALEVKTLRLDRATVISHYDAGASPLVDGAGLSLGLTWEGKDAYVSIPALHSDVPIASVLVEQLGLRAHWDGRAGHIEGLELATDQGSVSIRKASFDPYSMTGSVSLSANVPAETVRHYSGLTMPGEAMVTLEAEGGVVLAKASLELRVGEAGFSLEGQGGMVPKPWADVTYAFQSIEPDRLGLPVEGGFTGKGTIKGKGSTLEDLDAQVTLECQDCRFPPVDRFDAHIQAVLKDGDGSADVRVEALGSTVKVRGKVKAMKEVEGHYDVRVSDLATVTKALGLEPMKGAVTVKGDCSGPIMAPGCKGDLKVTSLAVAGATVRKAEARFAVKPAASPLSFDVDLTARDVAAGGQRVRRAHVKAKGNPKAMSITADVEVDEKNKGKVTIGLRPGPPLKVAIESGRGLVDGLAVELTGPGTVRLDRTAVVAEGLALKLEGMDVAVDGRFDMEGQSDIRVDVRGANLALLRRFVDKPRLAGLVNLQATLKGSSSSPRIGLTLDVQGLALDDKTVGSLKLGARWENRVIQADLTMDSAYGPLVSLKATVPASLNLKTQAFRWRQEDAHQVDWQLYPLSAARLRPFVALPEDLDFTLESQGLLNGTIKAFSTTLVVRGKVSQGTFKDVPVVAEVKVLPREQSFRLQVMRPFPAPLDVTARAQAPMEEVLAGKIDPMALPFQASAKALPFSLDVFNPLLPMAVYDLKGQAGVDLRVWGPLADLQVVGGLSLQGGSVSVLKLHQPLEKIKLDIQANGKTIALKEMSFVSGDGKGMMSGEVVLSKEGDVRGKLSLRLEDLTVESPGVPQSVINTEADILLKVQGGKTGVSVVLRKTAVKVYTNTSKAPRDPLTSQSVVFLDEAKKDEKSKEAKADGGSGEFEFRLKMKDPILIQGPIMDMAVSGDIIAASGPQGTQVRGGLEVQRGSFDFLGNVFQVENAKVNFPPGKTVEPYINLTAKAQVGDAQITMAIKGKAGAPRMILTSEPAMPQYQIFTLLVTGTPETTDESQDQIQGKAANLGMGLIALKFPELQRQLNSRIGIDRVNLSFGETAEEPIVTVGKRITRRLFIQTSYHHNAPEDVNQFEVKGEVMITPRWFLETFYGDANVGSVDVFWHAPLGKPAPEPVPEGKAPEGK